jgi:hypothetical protein
MEGYRSAGSAYNQVLRDVPSGTAVIFAHQDVYLPAGYGETLRDRIAEIERTDPDWAVLGLSTKTPADAFAGKVWSTAWNRIDMSDIALARAQGRKSYAIDAPVIHHDKPVIHLDRGFRKAYRFMRRKWWDSLPLPGLIAPLTRSIITMYEYDLRIRYLRRGATKRTVPTSDPSQIAKRLGWE